jgi:Concanavalin A-like lectin/glucanases superfamily/PASTA domain
MGIQGKVVAAIAGGLAVVALVPGIAAAKLVVADYRFDNSLASSVPGASALTSVGAGNAFATETVRGKSERVLTFPEGNGLSLVDSDIVPNDDYSVVLAFRFADLDDYDRILNTNGGPEPDYGLYSLTSGYLNFYDEDSDHAGDSAVIQADEYVEVGFTRDPDKRLTGYADGVRQFTYTDAGPDDARIGSDGLRFFLDDPGSEEAPGAVARIRLFNRALSADQVRDVFEGCKVPKVKGKKKKAAKKKVKKAGCSVGKTKKKFSDKVEKGRVIKQKPKKGAKRDFEFGVKLTISKGHGG